MLRKRNRFIACLLSLVVPGLGQIYKSETNKGALILAAAIIIANLNIIILPLISVANPVIPPGISDQRALWAYWIPRIVHDISALWSVVFWIWVVFDAFMVEKQGKEKNITEILY